MSDMMTPAELADYLRVKETTLKAWRNRNQGPPYIRVNGSVRYPTDDLKAYLDARRVNPAAA